MSLVVHADLQGRVSRRCLEYIRLSDLSAVPAISSCISPCVPAQLCMSHRHHLLGSQEGHSRAGHPAAGRQPTQGSFCPSGTEGAAGKPPFPGLGVPGELVIKLSIHIRTEVTDTCKGPEMSRYLGAL